eukprot:TRINITY_DN1246_c0_g1_i2.p1 TRINITY_DN1246_c0_g1~~TRINITY_DN1246_c0_g1_i2.p1  ORF type:complete len:408 (-),score=127.01 TRINITY_DN1246_c0_g1_i2:71-1294(-)
MSPKGNRVRLTVGKSTRVIYLKELSYLELLTTLKGAQHVPEAQLTIKYQDEEGDFISLSSEPEFEEALNCFEGRILNLVLEPKCGLSEQEAEQVLDLSSIEPLENLSSEEFDNQHEENINSSEPYQKQTEEFVEQLYEEVEEQLLRQHEEVHQAPTSEIVEVAHKLEEVQQTFAPGEEKQKKKRRRRTSKKQQKEKQMERKKEEEEDKKSAVRQQLKQLKQEMASLASENKSKAEELKNTLREESEKENQLLNELKNLQESIAEKECQFKLQKQESRAQMRALKQKIQGLELEVKENRAEETYPEVESVSVVQQLTPAVEPEDIIPLYKSPKKAAHSQGRVKLVRFDRCSDDFLHNERDREEELEHFENELAVLASMGFKNVNKNLSLLRKSQGQLEWVVNDLLLGL